MAGSLQRFKSISLLWLMNYSIIVGATGNFRTASPIPSETATFRPVTLLVSHVQCFDGQSRIWIVRHRRIPDELLDAYVHNQVELASYSPGSSPFQIESWC